jgi:hypothetical protein
MTATPRPRTPLALLAMAFLLVLLTPAGAGRAAGAGPEAGAAREAGAGWPAERMAPSVPLAGGGVTPRDPTGGLRPAADRRDQRGGQRPAAAALAAGAAAALLLAALVRRAAGGRHRPGRHGPASSRGPPPLLPA